MKFFKRQHLPDDANNDEEAMKVRKIETNDLMGYTREIWSTDKEMTSSIATEDRDIRVFFGCGVLVALEVWELVSNNLFVPHGGCIYHLLWAHTCLAIYDKKKNYAFFCRRNRQETFKNGLGLSLLRYQTMSKVW